MLLYPKMQAVGWSFGLGGPAIQSSPTWVYVSDAIYTGRAEELRHLEDSLTHPRVSRRAATFPQRVIPWKKLRVHIRRASSSPDTLPGRYSSTSSPEPQSNSPPSPSSPSSESSPLARDDQEYSLLKYWVSNVQKKPYSAITVQVERLTSEQYEEDDLSGIPDLIEVIRIQSTGPAEAARALRKKL